MMTPTELLRQNEQLARALGKAREMILLAEAVTPENDADYLFIERTLGEYEDAASKSSESGVTNAMQEIFIAKLLDGMTLAQWCRHVTNATFPNDVRAALEAVWPQPPAGDCVTVPRELTAENGAKAALIGEFHVSRAVDCHHCDGDGYRYEPADFGDSEVQIKCIPCGGTGSLEEKTTIDWPTIKAIWKSAITHFAASPAAQEPAPPAAPQARTGLK